jgi:hypothetical protein
MASAQQVSLLTDEPAPASASPSRTLTKSVHALAIEPLNMALTVTGRKAYDVMLWIAQRSSADSEGWYTSPVSAILKGYGSTSKASERVQRYIEQMVQTVVVWRPLAASEQGSLLSAGQGEGGTADTSDTPVEAFDGAESSGANDRESPVAPVRARGRARSGADEARTFPLLAEARLSVRNGEAWVKWYYPPSIREQLISPDRWAQIELNSLAQLSTYSAVALYEICARFKSSPGGLTSRHPPDFWIRVLREGGGIKPREWRKVKNELVVPAIAQINEASEITIELIEHRQGNAVVAVQFSVKRKAKDRDRSRGPADVASVVQAARHGIREADFDALILKYGSFKVAECLEAMEAHASNPTATKIANKLGYLRAVLANRYPDSQAELLSAAETRVVQKPIDEIEQQDLVRHWLASRFKQLNSEFAALNDDERKRWIGATATRFTTPAVRRRLDNQEWMSPLVNQLVLDAYATGTLGENWKTPSEIDLAMYKAADSRHS